MEIAKVVEFRATTQARSTAPIDSAASNSRFPEFARVVPGISRKNRRKPLLSLRTIPIVGNDDRDKKVHARSIAEELKPRVFERFEPAMLPRMLMDMAVVIAVFRIEQWCFGLVLHRAFTSLPLWFYLLGFLFFSIEEDVYSSPRQSTVAECGAMVRALAWATLLAGFSLRWSSSSSSSDGTIAGLAFFSTGNLFVLLGLRWLSRRIGAPEPDLRNVLIVGSGPRAQQVADAIYNNPTSRRQVKGFIAENHLRNVYGPGMLSRIAREDFIDEFIVVSSDPEVVDSAVREARHNLLDVSVVPQLSGVKSDGILLEKVGGLPLLGIYDYRPPEYTLAIKRSLDTVLGLLGLISLFPLLVAIAFAIKLSSPGPILYRAARIGRKGQCFFCYKFRTMIPDADAIKEGLRSRNERDGAFFKIEDDPRITRVGRFLRRYSLDELPQLWNVFLGHMSLVGPRPHPPDDVRLYSVQDLQRLDFVPGITGLWQVTARRDPSFQRSVALDVEYIRGWNLWLDLRILWQTIFAVLGGNGA